MTKQEVLEKVLREAKLSQKKMILLKKGICHRGLYISVKRNIIKLMGALNMAYPG